MSFWEWLVELVRRLRVARLRALSMEASSGAYSLAGFNANLTYARHLTMQALRGIFQWAGFNINLTKQKYTLGATRGLFAMTGRNAELTYTPAAEDSLGWLDNIFPMSIARGSFFDLSSHITGDTTDISTITANVSLPSGVTITSTPSWRIVASTGATTGTTSGVNLTINPVSDFQTRISGASVVWYHNFDTAAEVNAFRWTGAFGSGQDPNAAGEGGNLVSWQASGGADGGSFLRISYPAGSSAGQGNSYWWRPFNPFSSGHGKAADPGANGTVSTRVWSAPSGSGTTNEWAGASGNPGWYMHPTHQASNPGKFQGHDYYLQIRVRRASTPGAPPDNLPSYTNITGKHVWFSNTNYTYVVQELVGYGYSVGNGDQVGVQSRFNVYNGQNFTSLFDGQPNDDIAVSNLSVNWRYSGGWDTLLYHVTPGTNGGTSSNRTRVEVWAQHDPSLFPAESGVYTKVCDVTYTQSFDNNGTGPLPGWNALILAAYHNGSSFSTSWAFDYDQVIFSKATIPAPTV